MNSTKFLNEFAKQFSESLPPGLQKMQKEFEGQFRYGLQLALEKLELVTREEFETQTKVLYQTRETVEALERRIAALEASKIPPKE